MAGNTCQWLADMSRIIIYSGWVGIENFEISGPIGVFDFEREQGTNYNITLLVKLTSYKSFESDRLEDTVDYSILYRAIKKAFSTPAHLIEHVAHRIISELGSPLNGMAYRLTIKKLKPALSQTAVIGSSILELEGAF